MAFSDGQLRQLGTKLQKGGWTAKDITNLGQASPARLIQIRDLLRRSGELKGSWQTRLRRLYEGEVIQIEATDGTETFASAGLQVTEFPGLTGPARMPPAEAEVYEQIGHGSLLELFKGFGVKRGCWNQSQVVAFCRRHPDRLGRRSFDPAHNFFELEGGIVADVLTTWRGVSHVIRYDFSYKSPWGGSPKFQGNHRIFIPLHLF